MSFSNKTIFSKIFKLLFLSIIFFSVMFSFYFISEQKNQILNSLKNEAKSIATMITYASSDAIILDDGAYLVEFNHEFLNNLPRKEEKIAQKSSSA